MNVKSNIFTKTLVKKAFTAFTALSLVSLVSLTSMAFADGDVLPGHKRHSEHIIKGVKVAGGLTGIVQGLVNNNQSATVNDDTSDVSYSADLVFDIAVPGSEGSTLTLYFETAQGDGITGDIGSTFTGVNADAGVAGASPELAEVFFQTSIANDMVSVAVGKIDPTAHFDANDLANDETGQFLADDFVNNAAVEFPGYSLGFTLNVAPSDIFYASFGGFEGDSDVNNVFDHPFIVGEVGVTPKLGNLAGNYRFYGWRNGTKHEELKDSSKISSNYGFGLSFDQAVTDVLGVFFRLGWQDKSVSNYYLSEAFGISLNGKIFGRENDSFGIGYSMKHVGSDYKDTTGFDDTETFFETYYNVSISDYISIAPDFQWINNPMGNKDNNDIFVYGLRGQVNF